MVAAPIEEWERRPGQFDAVLCISTIEHVGLGWYGDPAERSDGDRRALERLGELLRPGRAARPDRALRRGLAWTPLQRRYDRAGLDALLDGVGRRRSA